MDLETLLQKANKILDDCSVSEYEIDQFLQSFAPESEANSDLPLRQQILNQLMNAEEIPDQLFETYCKVGTLIAEAPETSSFFRAQQMVFLAEQGRRADAYAIFQQLPEGVMEESFMEQWRQEFAGNDDPDALEPDAFEQELSSETDFSRYLDLLRIAAKRYTVLIASSDTPWGNGFTSELTKKLMAIGAKIDLYREFRCAYILAIDQETHCLEKIAPPGQILAASVELKGGTKVTLESRGYPYKGTFISIQGCKSEWWTTGMLFVVYDEVRQQFLDQVVFNTYSPHLPCAFRQKETNNRVAQWRKQHPNVSLFSLTPIPFPAKNLSESENFVLQYTMNGEDALQFFGDPRMPFTSLFQDKDEFAEVRQGGKVYIDATGFRKIEDYHSKYVNIVSGRRVTVGQPNNAKHTIYLIGPCHIYGASAKDEDTIASLLQKQLNESLPAQTYIVQRLTGTRPISP